MKINNCPNYSQTNANFKGIRLFNMQLPVIPKCGRKANCFISEMTKDDGCYFLQNQEYWQGTTFGGGIISDFLGKIYPFNNNISSSCKKTRFFMVEQPTARDSAKKVKALMKINLDNFTDTVDIINLQSAREIPEYASVSGAGQCLLYIASKLAQTYNKANVSLMSAENSQTIDFYHAVGLKDYYKGTKTFFTLSQEDFQKFQEKLEKKYSITPEYVIDDFTS